MSAKQKQLKHCLKSPALLTQVSEKAKSRTVWTGAGVLPILPWEAAWGGLTQSPGLVGLSPVPRSPRLGNFGCHQSSCGLPVTCLLWALMCLGFPEQLCPSSSAATLRSLSLCLGHSVLHTKLLLCWPLGSHCKHPRERKARRRGWVRISSAWWPGETRNSCAQHTAWLAGCCTGQFTALDVDLKLEGEHEGLGFAWC